MRSLLGAVLVAATVCGGCQVIHEHHFDAPIAQSPVPAKQLPPIVASQVTTAREIRPLPSIEVHLKFVPVSDALMDIAITDPVVLPDGRTLTPILNQYRVHAADTHYVVQVRFAELPNWIYCGEAPASSDKWVRVLLLPTPSEAPFTNQFSRFQSALLSPLVLS